MNILVTGGAGFIGSHLVERLLGDGHTVVCIDNFDSYYDPAIKRSNIKQALSHPAYTLTKGDVRDPVALRKCFEGRSIDVVAHLAARAGVRPSIANPELYYDVNVMGTLQLLEAMRTSGVRKLVFASSSSVYGNNPHVPFSESDNVDNPISPYAASKKAGELLCHTYSHLHKFDVYCLRFFTVFGPRQRPDMAIHRFLQQIMDDQDITLYGDGSSKRDYTYITDIVNGVERAIARARGYEIINLGESRITSLLDLISLIEAELGKKAKIEWRPMQPGDVGTTYADIAKAQRLLDYVPKCDVSGGLKAMHGWFSEGLSRGQK